MRTRRMENDRDTCNVKEKCERVRVYYLLHGYNYAKCNPMFIDEFLSTI